MFFIILVANVGGALTPLGDPPLFVGFLRGVDFFWTARNLLVPTAVTAALLLAVFLVVDAWFFRRDGRAAGKVGKPEIQVRGWINVVLIAAIILAILLSAAWPSAVRLHIGSSERALQNLARDLVLVVIAMLSLRLTRDEHREANGFTWEPIREVAKLFAGIFICIIPVLAMLAAGERAPNFMVYAIATARGVKMPSFFSNMGWSAGFLLPILAVLGVILIGRS